MLIYIALTLASSAPTAPGSPRPSPPRRRAWPWRLPRSWRSDARTLAGPGWLSESTGRRWTLRGRSFLGREGREWSGRSCSSGSRLADPRGDSHTHPTHSHPRRTPPTPRTHRRLEQHALITWPLPANQSPLRAHFYKGSLSSLLHASLSISLSLLPFQSHRFSLFPARFSHFRCCLCDLA
jgi:hypothetical protein